jgi:hypothetical protein
LKSPVTHGMHATSAYLNVDDCFACDLAVSSVAQRSNFRYMERTVVSLSSGVYKSVVVKRAMEALAVVPNNISHTHHSPYRDSHTARGLSNCGKRLKEGFSGIM